MVHCASKSRWHAPARAAVCTVARLDALSLSRFRVQGEREYYTRADVPIPRDVKKTRGN